MASLDLYTIYDHPADHPDHFVVRRWEVGPTGVVATSDVTLHATLDAAREAIPPYLACLHRYDDDDPVIVETWV